MRCLTYYVARTCNHLMLFCMLLAMYYFFCHRDFSPIIVPLQSSLTVTIPVSHEHHSNHNPFPGVLPKIIGFEDKVLFWSIVSN